MSDTAAILMGVVLGIASSLPAMFLFEQALGNRHHPRVAVGLICIVASFVVLSAAVLRVWLIAPGSVLVFGASEAVSFLLVWAVEAWRAWRAAQGDALGRKEEW